ncbi:extended synaptotagmin-2-like isoform X4 [Clavelina lepadiformis]|uniref:extended synaptotagmin-2-like isoform X4 n=1 Tax=Clavelina lepadiformis TaxID=159417 RepID=UPI00404316E2
MSNRRKEGINWITTKPQAAKISEFYSLNCNMAENTVRSNPDLGDEVIKGIPGGNMETNPDSAKSLENENSSRSISESVQNVLKTRFSNTCDMVKVGCTKFGVAAGIYFLGYFKFSLLWVFCGVCTLLYLTFQREKRKATSEVIKQNSDDPKKFMETVKEVYRINGQHLPSWLYYPDVEKAEWLNKIIDQLWPYIGSYIKNLVTEQIQPSIQQSSALLGGFTFTDVDLGDRAPRVSGIKVYGDNLTRRNEIIIDVQIVYESDCNIGMSVNRLQAGICDLRIRGLLRLEMQPLLEKMPLVGAVSAAFIHMPTIDFDLTHLANVFDFPGFDSLLRGAIMDSVGSIMVLPEKYIVKLCPDVDVSKLRYPIPQGIIRVHILEAKNLEEKDRKLFGSFGGGSDPFVVIKVSPSSQHKKEQIYCNAGHRQNFKTSIQHSINPTWNESFNVIVGDVANSNIQLSLFDDDGPLNKADDLGYARLPVKTVFEQGVLDEWIQLQEVTSGSIHVKLEWFDLSHDSKDLQEALNLAGANENFFSAFLNIYVDSAKNLPDSQQDSFDPSPCLRISLPGKETMKTKTAMHTNSPVWEENFRVLLNNPLYDQVVFELKDKRVRGKMIRKAFDKSRGRTERQFLSKVDNTVGTLGNLGVFRYSLKNLLHETDMTVERPFSMHGSGPNSVLNLRMTLRILKRKEKTNAPRKPNDITVHMSKSTSNTQRNGPRVETTLAPTPSPQRTTSQPSVDNVSEKSGTSSANIEFEGTPETNRLHPTSSFSVQRSSSISSEMSNIGAVDNLRKRLNAKLTSENGKKTIDEGLGRIMLTIRHSKNSLVVLVVKAENLIVCDEDNNTSDPYVRVYIVPDKKNRLKTKVIKNNLNPVFDQRLEFDISAREVTRKKLHVTVKNQTGFLSSEKVLMGQATIDLSELDLNQPTTQWYTLLPEI